MLELLTDPAVWASFLTLTILEIVLGVDNVIFISIASQKLPAHQQKRARFIGLSGALVLRILLLLSITWIIGLTSRSPRSSASTSAGATSCSSAAASS